MSIDLHDQWAEHLQRRGRSATTIRTYLSTIREAGDITTWTVDDADHWWHAQQDLAPRTRTRKLATLRSFAAWAIRFDHLAVDPTRRLDAPTLPTGAPRFVTRSALDTLRRNLPDDLRRAVVLGAWAGLRISEAAALDWSDIDPEARRLHVRHGKGDKSRTVGMSPLLLDELLPIPERGGNVVNGGGRPTSADTLQRRVNRAMAALGIPETFHGLRHRYGTTTYGRTGDPLAVAAAMGHASLETTRKYAAVSDDALDRVAAAAVQ